MAFGLRNSAARQGSGWPFESTQADDAGRVDRAGAVEAITTDGLRVCKAAMDELGNAGKQEIGRWASDAVVTDQRPSMVSP